MKKTFLLEDLDCAHCAAKIEADVKALEGIKSAALVFLTQKLNLDIEDGKEAEVAKAVKAIVKKYEPDVEVKAL